MPREAPLHSDQLTGALPRTDDRAYDLRQRMNRAVRWLREAEDIARVEMPTWPTADRIRSIYEQITEDLLNGRTTVPPMRQRLTEAEAERARLAEALEDAVQLNSGWRARALKVLDGSGESDDERAQ